MKHLPLVLLLALSGISVVACKTRRGIGQDIEAAGDAIEEATDEGEDELDD